ncbi:MAG: hypothetical protein O3B24_04485 [Verrucomicrobia bacterium]|nr:hypothetical protein [Verrucomicrobiota bacterium]
MVIDDAQFTRKRMIQLARRRVRQQKVFGAEWMGCHVSSSAN